LSIAAGMHLGLLVIGAFFIFRTIRPPQKKIDFLPSGRGGGGSEGVPVKKAPKKAMANPTSGLKRVFAEGATTSLALPPPGDAFDNLSRLGSLGGGGGLGNGMGGKGGFGHGTGAGNGFGAGLTGGLGGSAGAVTFFRQEIRAQRIAYVIDYSASMRGKREKLMRGELAKSVGQLSPLMQFQLIFFSGPVWLAGDKVNMAENHRSATVTSGATTYEWEPSQETPGGWEPKGKKPRPTWIDARRDALDKAGQQIAETPLVYGTYWIAPLEMALAMDPAPDLIFFMTDGVSASGKDPEVIKAIGHRAKSRKTVINTVAMMEPQAEESMKALAHSTGGQFSIIRPDGTVEVIPPG
jgi:hypothetical protein